MTQTQLEIGRRGSCGGATGEDGRVVHRSVDRAAAHRIPAAVRGEEACDTAIVQLGLPPARRGVATPRKRRREGKWWSAQCGVALSMQVCRGRFIGGVGLLGGGGWGAEGGGAPFAAGEGR